MPDDEQGSIDDAAVDRPPIAGGTTGRRSIHNAIVSRRRLLATETRLCDALIASG